MLKRQSEFPRQAHDFYATPAWGTRGLVLLPEVRLPKEVWEPCCGNGSMARELEDLGHHVVATDLEDRGYGEGGRDFMLETRMPDGVTAIVTNPPYDNLFEFVVHALKLTQPVGGMVALLVNHQWQAGQEASNLCRIPAFDATVVLTDRINWSSGIGVAATNRGNHNHCWLIWDWSRPADHARIFYVHNPEKPRWSRRWARRLDELPEWLR